MSKKHDILNVGDTRGEESMEQVPMNVGDVVLYLDAKNIRQMGIIASVQRITVGIKKGICTEQVDKRNLLEIIRMS